MDLEGFSRTYTIKWADLDTNGHLRYSVYIDYAVDTQFRSVEIHGYTPKKLMEMGFGPAILRMETRYQREVTFDETVVNWLKITGMSPDGARWKSRHDIVKSNGETAASIKLEGIWIDIRSRQAIAPPPDFLEILNLIPRIKDFEILRSFVRNKK